MHAQCPQKPEDEIRALGTGVVVGSNHVGGRSTVRADTEHSEPSPESPQLTVLFPQDLKTVTHWPRMALDSQRPAASDSPVLGTKAGRCHYV